MATQLKDIVDGILKTENRPLSWLAAEMDMTFDGLKLSLMKGSLKYNDMKRMASILKVQPNAFFNIYDNDDPDRFLLGEEKATYSNLKSELISCKELVNTLKSQVKDKEKIIELLGGDKE